MTKCLIALLATGCAATLGGSPEVYGDAAVDGAGDAVALDPDAALDAPIGSPIACPGPFVVCEDFETAINTAVWSQSGTLAIDGTRAHRGTHSIKFSANNSLLRTTRPFPQLAHDLWARVFVYMNQTPPDSNSSFSWAAGNGGVTRTGFRHMRNSGGYNYPGSDFTNTDDQAWPLNQWVCVEWHYHSDASGMGTQDYWLNGMPRPLMHFGPHPMPAFTYFWIGMYLFGTTPYSMWMDDLVIDTHQVGCNN
jgi:hypothetical protein